MAQREPGPLALAAALAVCCTITLIVVAGGAGIATGVVGGWLRNPWVIAAGLALVLAAVAAYVIGRNPPQKAVTHETQRA